MKHCGFNLDDCVMLLTSRASKRLSALLEQRFAEFGITRVQWFALYYTNCSGNVTQRELADLMGIKEPTVVRLLDRCEKEGLLQRVPSQSDKRKKMLALTQKGETLNAQLTKVAEQFMHDAIAGISQDDLDTYINVIEKMLSNVDK